jgi:SAM-dependent methyltransferase
MAYESSTYGDRIASVYDDWVAPVVDPQTDYAAAFLAKLAREGSALELGIGTGRIALPLAERRVRVHGIDASEAMVSRMREKAGGSDIQVTLGDFAEVPVEGSFDLIYVVFNTFFALLSQEAQLECFARVARHLAPDGFFVLEAFVPDPTLFDRGQRVSATRVEMDRVMLDATRHDPVYQRLSTQHVMIGKDGIVLLPVELRYAWPSELDLMARLATMRLETRFGGWQREVFTAASPSHVSVYVHDT